MVELTERRPEARVLQVREERGGAEIGVEDEGEWVPLLKTTGGSKACNVMWLQAFHGSQWLPTGLRGTPATLAEKLAESHAHLWSIAVAAIGFSSGD